MMKKTLIFLILSVFLMVSCSQSKNNNKPIDRYALVHRHNIEITKIDTLASLSVGNGEFAFTTDITGLQTFYKEYEKGMPLGTQSNWGWHSNPNIHQYKREECEKYFDFQGRKVPYLHQLKEGRGKGASDYFRENPHRLHLGIIRLIITKKDGSSMRLNDVMNPSHKLDLWTGKISSSFTVDGENVNVELFCHQDQDLVSVRIESELVSNGNLAIEWIFPYGVPKNTDPGYNFNVPDKHTSNIITENENFVQIERVLDTTKYYTAISWKEKADFKQVGKHTFHLKPVNQDNILEFSSSFSEGMISEDIPGFDETKENNITNWESFWKSGAAVDFSECKDKRAHELERRTVLSQYLIQIQSSGKYPPAETGLTYNSWYGKFHLEMHWWHAVHFALWGRAEYLEKQMPYYQSIEDSSRAVAQRQGFKGLRWPKMVGLQGMNSPSSVGSYLIWQQPHYIYYAELLYRENAEKALEDYSHLVFETAEFMADFPQYDAETDVYNLLPPLIPAQEHWSRETTTNPPFELSQWYWGLSTAIKWKERLNQPVDQKWIEVRDKLAKPEIINGVYPGIAGAGDSYSDPDKMRREMAMVMYKSFSRRAWLIFTSFNSFSLLRRAISSSFFFVSYLIRISSSERVFSSENKSELVWM